MKKFFIAKMLNKLQEGSFDAINIYEKYGILCSHMPILMSCETKNTESYSWAEEDGEDFFIPNEGLKISSGTIEVDFLSIDTTPEGCLSRVNRMVSVLKEGAYLIHDEWSGYGYVACIFDGISEKGEFYYSNTDNTAALEFSISFKVMMPHLGTRNTFRAEPLTNKTIDTIAYGSIYRK